MLTNRPIFLGYGDKTAQLIQEDSNLNIISLSTLQDLTNAMTDEFLAMYQYFAEVRILENVYKDQIIKEFKQHAIEEYKHAGMIADRIMALGGKIITRPDILFSSRTSECGYIEPKSSDAFQLVTDAINGEQCAIKSYTVMANNAKELGDFETYDMLFKIIQDEMEHNFDLNKLILEFGLTGNPRNNI